MHTESIATLINEYYIQKGRKRIEEKKQGIQIYIRVDMRQVINNKKTNYKTTRLNSQKLYQILTANKQNY